MKRYINNLYPFLTMKIKKIAIFSSPNTSSLTDIVNVFTSNHRDEDIQDIQLTTTGGEHGEHSVMVVYLVTESVTKKPTPAKKKKK
tara:strand:- start:4854 stop:5111 length:258 start_codon:yes stop_codon:yes gene_type:complete